MSAIVPSRRLSRLQRIASFAAAALFIKVLIAILAEYRWYFPPNFESAFLVGRRDSFVGVYRAAFYSHIVSGPLAIICGCYLMLSAGRAQHRWVGRMQMLIIVAVVAPSGLIMAWQAHAGPLAGLGFAALALSTAACAIAAGISAWSGQWNAHQRWASRCFLLVCSPLLLRLIAGAAMVLQLESDGFYRLNAWLSWLMPLGVYELWWRHSERGLWKSSILVNLRSNQQAYP